MATPDTTSRVTVVTNGNYFACLALAPLIALAGDGFQLQVIVTTGLRKQRGNRLAEAWKLLRRWGLRYFLYKLSTYVIPTAAEFVGRGPRTVLAACRARGVNVIVARNVNHRDVRGRIAEFTPDILLSVSCPYRIKPAALALPSIGCLNLHSSLLPAYAGVCTYIHVLAAGERTTGITLHEMVEDFDAGRIVAQQAIEIRPGTSVCELFRTQCSLAGPMVAKGVVTILCQGRIDGTDQDPCRRSYRGEPEAGDIRTLRRLGFALMHRRDARALWSQDPGLNEV